MKPSGCSLVPRPVRTRSRGTIKISSGTHLLIRSLRHSRRLREVSLVAVAALASACAGNYHLVPAPAPFSHPSLGVTWLTPHAARDAAGAVPMAGGSRAAADRQPATRRGAVPVDTLTIVSWNMALGEGDLEALLRTRQAGSSEAPRSCCCCRKRFAAATMCRARR